MLILPVYKIGTLARNGRMHPWALPTWIALHSVAGVVQCSALSNR